jgi:hypothetical protein
MPPLLVFLILIWELTLIVLILLPQYHPIPH